MTAKTTKPKRDVEAEVTERVIEALESGTVPWRQPWTASGILPTSVASNKPYRGINAMLLAMTALMRGYDSPYWMTYNQAAERGGNVIKGEHGTQVVFWKRFEVKDDTTETGKRSVFLSRFFTVFNLEQTENVELPPRFTPPADLDVVFAVEDAQAIWSGYADGPQLNHQTQDAAFYSPDRDVITLPKQGQFASAEAYYGTLFHESIHSTGHPSRLDRFAKTGEPQHFGSERYAREELVAELGAAMLRAMAGIDTDDSTEQSAAYVKNWLTALKDDKTLVLAAAGKAQKAVDRIVGTTFDTDDDQTATAA